MQNLNEGVYEKKKKTIFFERIDTQKLHTFTYTEKMFERNWKKIETIYDLKQKCFLFWKMGNKKVSLIPLQVFFCPFVSWWGWWWEGDDEWLKSNLLHSLSSSQKTN